MIVSGASGDGGASSSTGSDERAGGGHPLRASFLALHDGSQRRGVSAARMAAIMAMFCWTSLMVRLL